MEKGPLAAKGGAFPAEGKGSVRDRELGGCGSKRSSFIHSLMIYLLSADHCAAESQSLKTGQKEASRLQGFRALGAWKPHSGTWAFVLKQREAVEQLSIRGHHGVTR